MTPDLSKLKVGSRVTFVADAEIIKEFHRTTFFSIFPRQIISIEPPAFEWAEVRPGMRFWDDTGSHCWYIGPHRLNKGLVYVENCDGYVFTIIKSDLTPAPEGDAT